MICLHVGVCLWKSFSHLASSLHTASHLPVAVYKIDQNEGQPSAECLRYSASGGVTVPSPHDPHPPLTDFDLTMGYKSVDRASSKGQKCKSFILANREDTKLAMPRNVSSVCPLYDLRLSPKSLFFFFLWQSSVLFFCLFVLYIVQVSLFAKLSD